MQSLKLLSPLSLIVFLLLSHQAGQLGVEAACHHLPLFGFCPLKFFVFGDSYADTGNTQISSSKTWNYPYGITFPGRPSGRFSNGRVLTDFIARSLGMKSPLPYELRRNGGKQLKNGMNFAVGGSGVFHALNEPNMTTQIGYLQNLIKHGAFTQEDLQNSLVLVTLSGNDYSWYLTTNGSAQGFPAFITSVVNQLTMNLNKIYELGAKKVAVTTLPPLGCLPSNTVLSSYKSCNDNQNSLVNLHNQLLQQAVAKMNNETKESTFFIIDLYDSFLSVLNKGKIKGSSKFVSLLKPCCDGISSEYSCGSVDEKGNKMYTVCQHPDSAFFWDGAHPTQNGWNAVYNQIKIKFRQQFN